MWPAAARIVIARFAGRSQLCTGPMSSAPQSRCSRSPWEPGPSPKRALTSFTAAARSHSLPVLPGRQGSSTGAGSSTVSRDFIRAVPGASRSRAALVSGSAPASRL